jgi:hypothetical protein
MTFSPDSPALPSPVEIEPAIRQRDKRAIQTLLWALKPLSNLRGSIPLPYAVVFLTVALEEGKTMSAYARELGIDNAAPCPGTCMISAIAPGTAAPASA